MDLTCQTWGWGEHSPDEYRAQVAQTVPPAVLTVDEEGDGPEVGRLERGRAWPELEAGCGAQTVLR